MQNQNRQEYENIHIYSDKAALCFRSTQIETGKVTAYTVNIDAAMQASSPKKGEKYAWSDKINIQLTLKELLRLIAFLLGSIDEFIVNYHGSDRKKNIRIKSQEAKLFCTVNDASKTVALPITPEDAFLLTPFLINQVLKNYNWMTSSDVIILINRVLARIYNNT